MNMTIQEKDKIYDFIVENKSKFIYRKKMEDKNLKLLELLSTNDMLLPVCVTITNVFSYLTNHWDKKCQNEKCQNERKFFGFFPKRIDFFDKKHIYGIYKFCGKKCNYENISDRQMGENNTSHRMTEETFIGMCRKNSKKMKENIKEGRFIPNITNSWAKSRCDISFNRNGENVNIKTRSTWDAYFQLYNTHLLYEKLIIGYKFKKEYHNYIVDFVDHENKIIYEIKPNSTAKDIKNLAKERYARKWCKDNGYRYVMIKNRWFKRNYNRDLVIGQPCEDKLLRNLRQFV